MIIEFLVFIAVVIVIFGVAYLCYTINDWYNRHFKQDCFKCKHWYLANVASYGDGCEWACKKTKRRTIPMISGNQHTWYVKCKEFENEDK